MTRRKRHRSPPSPALDSTLHPRKSVHDRTRKIPSPSQDAEPAYNADLDPNFVNVLGDGSQRVNLGIDFGTSSCAAYFAIVPDEGVSPLDIKTIGLDLQRSVSTLPAFVALQPIIDTEDAVLIFGKDVNIATEGGEISWNDVWVDLKQANFLLKVSELPLEKQHDIIRLHEQHKRILDSANRYRRIIFRHGWMKQEEVVALRTMEDVVDKFLRYFLMEIKSAFRRKSVLSKKVTDDLISGDEESEYKDRARVGVAIPEVWTWQRMVIYRIFRNAGFHEKLELLSEGRCALTKGIKDVVEEHMRAKNMDNPRIVRHLNNVVFVGIDDGGYTLDGAIMQLVQKGSLIKLAVIGNGLSSQNGSNRANDIFRGRVLELFGERNLPEVLKQLQVPKRDLVLNLERGFESAKCDINPDGQEKVPVVYKGFHTMKRNKSSLAEWAEKSVRIDRDEFLSYLKDAIEEKFAQKGPITELLVEANQVAGGRSIHVIFSGGGSKSELLRNRALVEIDKLPIKLSFAGTGSASCVAEGACLMLSDPDLSRGVREAKKSYGIVITAEFDSNNAIHKMRLEEKTSMLPHADKAIAGKEDMPHPVVWKVKLNDPVRFQMKQEPMQQTIWTENDGFDDPDDSSDGWMFELPLVETEDPIVGRKDGYSAKNAAIQDCGALQIPISKEVAEYIGRAKPSKKRRHGFHQDKDGRWRLDFDYVLSYQWRGMLQYFEVKIPQHSVVSDGNIEGGPEPRIWTFWRNAEWVPINEKWNLMRV